MSGKPQLILLSIANIKNYPEWDSNLHDIAYDKSLFHFRIVIFMVISQLYELPKLSIYNRPEKAVIGRFLIKNRELFPLISLKNRQYCPETS